jgi:thiamine biosynthesis protein ThiS
MQITVNGQKMQVPDGCTLADLIAIHQLTPDKVAVELNRRIIRTAAYDTVLNPGDEVEIVTFVGGG